MNYSKMTYKEIANSLNLTESQIKHRIQRHLKIKPSKRKKHFHNEVFFNEESANKFYVLGLISADGNLFDDNCKNRYKVSVSLHVQDIELLNKINEIVCKTKIVYTRTTSKQSELVIYNKSIYNKIKSYGICERKSLNLDFPNIPKEFEKDFIRGYFDGDGSISVGKMKNYSKVTIQFLGTENFLNTICKIINRELGISIKNVNNTKSNVMCLRYFTKEARAILKWMYDDSDLKLIRKYNKYLKISNMFND